MRHTESHLYHQKEIIMSIHGVWLYHLHLKKRKKQKLRSKAKKIAKWLASKMLKEQLKQINKPSTKIQIIMDKLIYIVALVWPLLTLPQVWNVWIDKNAAGLSLFTWAAYVISPILWLIYGIVHKEKAIIFSNILWMTVDLSVLIGAIIYG